MLFLACDTLITNPYNDYSSSQCDSLIKQYNSLSKKQQEFFTYYIGEKIKEDIWFLESMNFISFPENIQTIDKMQKISENEFNIEFDLLKYHSLMKGVSQELYHLDQEHRLNREKTFDILNKQYLLTSKQRIFLYLTLATHPEKNQLKQEDHFTNLNYLNQALFLAKDLNDSIAISRIKLAISVCLIHVQIYQQAKEHLEEIRSLYSKYIPEKILDSVLSYLYYIYLNENDFESAIQIYPYSDHFDTNFATILLYNNYTRQLQQYLNESIADTVNNTYTNVLDYDFAKNNYYLWLAKHRNDDNQQKLISQKMRNQMEVLIEKQQSLLGYPAYMEYMCDYYLKKENPQQALEFLVTYLKHTSYAYLFDLSGTFPRFRMDAYFNRLQAIDFTKVLYAKYAYVFVTKLEDIYIQTNNQKEIRYLNYLVYWITKARINTTLEDFTGEFATFLHSHSMYESLKNHKENQEIYVFHNYIILVIGLMIILLIFAFFYFTRKDKINISTLYFRQKAINKQNSERVKRLLSNDENERIFHEVRACILNEQLFLKSDLTIIDITNKLPYNRTYISQAINKYTKLNFNQWLNQIRINYLITHLDSINGDFENHFQSYGFASRSTFYRAFKQHTGYTPNQYSIHSSNIIVNKSDISATN